MRFACYFHHAPRIEKETTHLQLNLQTGSMFALECLCDPDGYRTSAKTVNQLRVAKVDNRPQDDDIRVRGNGLDALGMGEKRLGNHLPRENRQATASDQRIQPERPGIRLYHLKDPRQGSK